MYVTLTYDDGLQVLALDQALDRIQSLELKGEALMDGSRRLVGVSHELAAEMAGYVVTGQERAAARLAVNKMVVSGLSKFEYLYATGKISRQQLGGMADELDKRPGVAAARLFEEVI
jgi:hypothetical protein